MKPSKTGLIIAAGILSGQANASGVEVLGLRLVRQAQESGQAQGQMEIAVMQGSAQEIQVRTLSCNQQELSAEQQERSQFQLAGQEALEAQAVLQNQVRLASEQELANPSRQQGRQLALAVLYRYLSGGVAQEASVTIQSPLVIIGQQVSTVLEKIEQQARAAAQESCDQ